jgi:hypothetical protein
MVGFHFVPTHPTFTLPVLGIAAMIGERTITMVSEALEKVSTRARLVSNTFGNNSTRKEKGGLCHTKIGIKMGSTLWLT